MSVNFFDDSSRNSLVFMYNGEITEIVFEQYTTTMVLGLGKNDDVSRKAYVGVTPWSQSAINETKYLNEQKRQLIEDVTAVYPDLLDRFTFKPIIDRDFYVRDCKLPIVSVVAPDIYGDVYRQIVPVLSIDSNVCNGTSIGCDFYFDAEGSMLPDDFV